MIREADLIKTQFLCLVDIMLGSHRFGGTKR